MFIALEGGDGSGKTSLIKVLSYYLASLGIPAITTREPGGTPMAEKMRSMVLTNAVCPLAELYLFAAARAEHCTDVVIPALLRGDWVLCDRFSGSTYVYQQCEKGLSKDLVESLDLGVQNLFAAEGLKHVLGVTDLEIVLDVGFDVAQERLNYRLGSPEGLNRLDTLDRTRFRPVVTITRTMPNVPPMQSL